MARLTRRIGLVVLWYKYMNTKLHEAVATSMLIVKVGLKALPSKARGPVINLRCSSVWLLSPLMVVNKVLLLLRAPSFELDLAVWLLNLLSLIIVADKPRRLVNSGIMFWLRRRTAIYIDGSLSLVHKVFSAA